MQEVRRQKVKSYRDLIVWQKSHALVKRVISISEKFPATDAARIIKKQLIRSATSAPANIAEGYGGNKGRIFPNSLTIARRESSETDYWLLLSYELGYIDNDVYHEVENVHREVRAILSSLTVKLAKSPDS